MAAGYGVGASLAGMGNQQKHEALGVLKGVADEESSRNRQNQALEAQEKAGKQQLGSTLGSMAGFAMGAKAGGIGGPWGALIGGAVGYVAAGLL